MLSLDVNITPSLQLLQIKQVSVMKLKPKLIKVLVKVGNGIKNIVTGAEGHTANADIKVTHVDNDAVTKTTSLTSATTTYH